MRSSGFGIIKRIFFLHFFLNFSTYANYKTYFVLIFLGTLNYQVTALGFVCKILLGTSITLDGDGGFRYTLLFVISKIKVKKTNLLVYIKYHVERPAELNLISISLFESLEHDNSLNFFAGKFLLEMGEIRYL